MRRIVFALLLAAAACGSPKPVVKPVADTEPVVDPKKKSQTWGELGVLNVGKVDAVFAGLKDALTACNERGNKFAAGSITYAIRVDHQGAVKYAYAKDTELGDREIERCMLNLIRKATWPTPEGGDDGIIEKPITFPDREERPPEDWTADKVLPAVGKLKAKLQKCREGHTGMFRATMIVDKSGKVMSVGIASPDDKGEAAIDCMADALKTLKLPSPGSWPARVSFELP
ncbi:MAG: hypothetical protein HY898_12700 [Deltaproteobacteria bacterium]|nr:hypothetical protein [Deltaproteobacteria bacterium]